MQDCTLEANTFQRKIAGLFAKALAVAPATLKALLGDVMDSIQPIRRMLSTTTLHAKAATIPMVSTRRVCV
jgi:hypothetical protein